MLFIIDDPTGGGVFSYAEDAREYIEGLWNDMLVQKLDDDDESFVMLQENEDEIEDGNWDIDFHSESELSDEAESIVDELIESASGDSDSDKIMNVVKATVTIRLD